MLNNSFNLPGASAGANGGADAVSSQAPSDANADMFTKLLVAQIRNQDPLSPSDPTQFVNQLSQLSQTEALQNLAKLNGSSTSVLQSLQVLALGAQVGSEVMAATPSVQLDSQPVRGAVTLDDASTATTLVLTGADQQPHKIELGSHGAGPLEFTIDPVKLGLAPGNYALQVQTSSGATVDVEIAGRLDSVRMSAAGGVILKVANIGEIAPSAITGFNGKSSVALAAASSATAY